MRTMRKALPALALLAGVGVAGAQQFQPKAVSENSPKTATTATNPATKKSALEEALELALKNNPDLRVAASKLALAEAELSKTRLQVTQKVAASYADVEVARATLREAERQVARMAQLRKNGVISSEELSKFDLHVVEAKAKLAAAERELEHLQGKGGRTDPMKRAAFTDFYRRTGHEGAALYWELDGGRIVIGSDARIPGTTPPVLFRTTTKTDGSDKLRQALQKPVTLSGHGISLADYLAQIKKTAGVGIQADLKDPAWKETVEFDFKDVTVGGMLQFLEDSLPGHRIVVRHYGLLVTPAVKVPEGAVTLTAFLHAEPRKSLEPPRPPAPPVAAPKR